MVIGSSVRAMRLVSKLKARVGRHHTDGEQQGPIEIRALGFARWPGCRQSRRPPASKRSRDTFSCSMRAANKVTTSGVNKTMAVNSPTGMCLRLKKANTLVASNKPPRSRVQAQMLGLEQQRAPGAAAQWRWWQPPEMHNGKNMATMSGALSDTHLVVVSRVAKQAMAAMARPIPFKTCAGGWSAIKRASWACPSCPPGASSFSSCRRPSSFSSCPAFAQTP